MKKVGFICSTPLQLVNCLNIACNEYIDDSCEKILFFEYTFKGAKEIKERLDKLRIFNQIYCFESYMQRIGEGILARVENLLFPKYVLKKMSLDRKIEFFEVDELYASVLNYFSRLVMFAYKYKNIIEYEDGFANYIGNAFNVNLLSRTAFFLNKYVLFKGKLMPIPDTLYLNCAELYTRNDRDVIQMKSIDEGNIISKYLNIVFGYKENNLYTDKNLVLLSQCVDKYAEKFQMIENEIIEQICSKYEDEYIIRSHPRQTMLNSNKYVYDTINNIWELECFNQIRNESILISIYSTATIMPVVLKGVKPYIIFLFELLDYEISDYEKREIINLAKSLYGKDSWKIIVLERSENILNIISTCRTSDDLS
jgi:hypothetical protein